MRTATEFSELARFKASALLLSDVKEAASKEGQSMSEFIRGSLRYRLRSMNAKNNNTLA